MPIGIGPPLLTPLLPLRQGPEAIGIGIGLLEVGFFPRAVESGRIVGIGVPDNSVVVARYRRGRPPRLEVPIDGGLRAIAPVAGVHRLFFGA